MEVIETEINTKKLAVLFAVMILASVGITALVSSQIGLYEINLHINGGIPVDIQSNSIHTTITVTKSGQIIRSEYHAGAVTKLGKNMSFCKWTGNATLYNQTVWSLNLTYMSIGNMGTLNSDSTVLPNEWNRTVAMPHDPDYTNGKLNFTAVFRGTTGTQTADCFGLNYESGIGCNALWGYDTFTEVTGIDSAFTITLEMQVSIT